MLAIITYYFSMYLIDTIFCKSFCTNFHASERIRTHPNIPFPEPFPEPNPIADQGFPGKPIPISIQTPCRSHTRHLTQTPDPNRLGVPRRSKAFQGVSIRISSLRPTRSSILRNNRSWTADFLGRSRAEYQPVRNSRPDHCLG